MDIDVLLELKPLEDHLEAFTNSFEQWRYAYEHETLVLNQTVLYELMQTVEEVCPKVLGRG